MTPVPPGTYPVAAERSLGLLASAWEGFTFWVAHAARFLTMSVLLGSLGFINSWDLPTFLGLVCFAAGVRNYLSEGRLSMSVVGRTLGFTVPLAALSFVLYLPFYVNFHPVGGAILPIQLAPIEGWPPIETMATRPHHFAYLWATILWPTLTFAVVALGPWRSNRSILRWALLPAFVPFLAWLFLVTASHGPLGLIDEIRSAARKAATSDREPGERVVDHDGLPAGGGDHPRPGLRPLSAEGAGEGERGARGGREPGLRRWPWPGSPSSSCWERSCTGCRTR